MDRSGTQDSARRLPRSRTLVRRRGGVGPCSSGASYRAATHRRGKPNWWTSRTGTQRWGFKGVNVELALYHRPLQRAQGVPGPGGAGSGGCAKLAVRWTGGPYCKSPDEPRKRSGWGQCGRPSPSYNPRPCVVLESAAMTQMRRWVIALATCFLTCCSSRPPATNERQLTSVMGMASSPVLSREWTENVPFSTSHNQW